MLLCIKEEGCSQPLQWSPSNKSRGSGDPGLQRLPPGSGYCLESFYPAPFPVIIHIVQEIDSSGDR